MLPLTPSASHTWMGRALDVARATPPADVPVGAVIFDPSGREIAAATNRRETDSDPTAHAEVLAIRHACAVLHDGWRLENCILVVTLEPCVMCAGAIAAARLGGIVYGAFEPKTGAVGSVWDVLRDGHSLHTPQVRAGVREEECAELMRSFFAQRR